jgi:serine/threonine kinase 16
MDRAEVLSGLWLALLALINQALQYFRFLWSLATTVLGVGERIDIGGRRLKVGAQIAEGGFSFVHCCSDEASGEQFALKRIIAQLPEQEKAIAHEIEVHRAFDHPNLLPLLGYRSAQGRAGVRTYNLLLPLCRGSVEDELNAMRIPPPGARGARDPGTFYSEKRALAWFAQACSGLLEFHRKRPDAWAHRDVKPANVLFAADDGRAMLMDFGSTKKARVDCRTRSDALRLQEWAAEHCSMPYRAPELFDVETGSSIDERTDIWSLGCTLFAALFGYSPFECEFSSADRGGKSSKPALEAVRVVECTYLRVINGVPAFPRARARLVSDGCLSLVKRMLRVDPKQRPFLGEVVEEIERLIGADAAARA